MQTDTGFALRLVQAHVAYNAVEAVRSLDLSVARGEFVALVGPSGCGKTTILSLLSGHLFPTSGIAEREGPTRTVHQSDGLFPWRTVAENIALGLSPQLSEKEADEQIQNLVALAGLEGFANHYPRELSGGMRQRAEIARALAGNSDAPLLLDEPFSALDYLTRLRMRGELATLLSRRPRTVVLVTHDIEEAAQLADRIIVLSARPATVREALTLSTPRPREVTSEEVTQTVAQVLRIMGVGH
jgi:ABC-type nitrate/sulfonate/bicarbonate transport system ATPase subunit